MYFSVVCPNEVVCIFLWCVLMRSYVFNFPVACPIMRSYVFPCGVS